MKKEDKSVQRIRKRRERELKRKARDEKVKEIEEEVKKEVLLNVPNTLTIIRLISAFVFVFLLFSGYSRLLLTIVFVIGAITDFLDGQIARRFNQTTKVGARLDQVVDRIFAVMVVVSLGTYFLLYSHEKIFLLFIIMSRELIGLPGVVIRLFRRVDTYNVKYIGKATTFIQFFAIGAVVLGASWSVYLAVPTCIIGILSGFDYLRDSLG
jgi:CDP-diacylglycerol--glycerol-3-phosphate 3-phosphatidyltransferase